MTTSQQHEESLMPMLTLFVNGTAPRSQRARANLAHMLEHIGRGDVRPYEVDMLKDPEQGITNSVFATPTLIKTSANGEVSVLYGDLSDRDRLQRFLQDLSSDS